MKNLEHIKGLDELPEFLTEDWIKQAMEKVDKSQMTPEQRAQFEMMLAKNASIIQMRQDEMKEAEEKGAKAAELVAKKAAKETAKKSAKKLKELGVENSVISESLGLSIEEIERL